MKLTVAHITLSIILGSAFASAVPLSSRQNQGGAKGAIYFISNDPKENRVNAAAIGADGKLALKASIRTGGSGAHGVTSPNGPDPLFSQGSVKASQASEVLATVNAGSNTVSAFKINPKNPLDIKPLGLPVSSGGEFPMSLGFNKAGTQLCVLNSGEVNGVKCFKVDPKNGLSPLRGTERALGLNQTTPANGPANTASHIIFSEDGKQVMATVKGVPDKLPGFIAAWDVAADGSLSKDFKKIALPKGGLLPFSMTLIPGQNSMLVTDAAIGFDLFDTGKGGRQSNAVPINGQGATCWSSFSPKTKNLYLTDIKTSIVTEVNVDAQLKGKVVKQYPLAKDSATIDNEIATIGGKDFLYVMSPGKTSINVLSLDAPGNAKPLQTLEFSGAFKKAKLAIDGNNIQGITSFVTK